MRDVKLKIGLRKSQQNEIVNTLTTHGEVFSNISAKCIIDHVIDLMLLLLLLFTRPLPRNGGMAEDHGAPEAGQLPRVWTRGHKETESRQRVSGAKSP